MPCKTPLPPIYVVGGQHAVAHIPELVFLMAHLSPGGRIQDG